MFISTKAQQLWNKLNDAIDESPVTIPCRYSDPDAWFPDPKDTNIMGFRNAKSLCADCPVKMPCLEYAITNNESHGIWGGLTYKERVAFRRK